MKLDSKVFVALFVSGALSSSLFLTGCESHMVTDTYEDIDMITADRDSMESSDLSRTVMKSLPVDGQDFKLVVRYNTDDNVWRITSNKTLNIKIRTEGLSDDKEVFIDNIHTDTYIVSTHPTFNGIKQDEMDDRIHNSLMLGFPIDDNNTYSGDNAIEGQNEQFTSYYYSEHDVSSETLRRTEEGYLSDGVYANLISSGIDLLVRDKKTGKTTAVTVSDSVLVKINNRIDYSDGTYYKYDEYGGYIKYNSDGKVIGSKSRKL